MPRGIYIKTKQHGINISKAKKGKRTSIATEFKKGHSLIGGGFKNKKHLEKSKEKTRLFNLGRPNLKTQGLKHWNWKGGITDLRNQIYNSSQWKQWRRAVFERDNYTCQECNAKSGNGKTIRLEAHHNHKGFSQLLIENHIETLEDASNCNALWDIDNGKTLCDKCHNLTKKGCNTLK